MNHVEYLKLLSALRFHLDIPVNDLQNYLNEEYADNPIKGLANLIYESDLKSITEITRAANALGDAYRSFNEQYNDLEIEFIKFYCRLNGIHNNDIANPREMYDRYQLLIHSTSSNNLPNDVKAEVARLMLHFYFVLHLDFTELRNILESDDE